MKLKRSFKHIKNTSNGGGYYFKLGTRTFLFVRTPDESGKITKSSGWDIVEDLGYDFHAESQIFNTLRAAKEYFKKKYLGGK
jgi:hypothetical protein